MDSKVVNKELRRVIRPMLKSLGFDTFTDRNAWHHTETHTDVINFQSFNDYLAHGVGCTTYSFAINLGRRNAGSPPHWNPNITEYSIAKPDEAICEFRGTLHRRMHQPELKRDDVWYVSPEGADLEAVVEDARQVILSDGMAWFAELDDLPALLDVLLNADSSALASRFVEGCNRDSCARNYRIGQVARLCGRVDLSEQYLARAAQQWKAIHERIGR